MATVSTTPPRPLKRSRLDEPSGLDGHFDEAKVSFKKSRVDDASIDSTASEVAAEDEQEQEEDGEEESHLETWEDVLELWETCMAKGEDGSEPTDSIPLLRGLIWEMDRIIRNEILPLGPQPSVSTVPQPYSPSSRSNSPLSPFQSPSLSVDGDDNNMAPEKLSEPAFLFPPVSTSQPLSPLSFYFVYGSTLLMLGQQLSLRPDLTHPDEPSPSQFYITSISLFQKAVKSCQRNFFVYSGAASDDDSASGRGYDTDWRLEIQWGRALIGLAGEKLEEQHNNENEGESPSILGNSMTDEPVHYLPVTAANSVPNSPLNSVHALADPGSSSNGRRRSTSAVSTISMMPSLSTETVSKVNGRPSAPHRSSSSLEDMSPSAILTLAADHFLLGILHVPHISSSESFSPSTHQKDPTTSFLRQPTSSDRLHILLSIATSISILADRFDLSDRHHRRKWALWADGLFHQIETDPSLSSFTKDQQHEWHAEVAVGRGGLWLALGAGLSEGFDEQLESEAGLDYDQKDVRETRKILEKAVGYLRAIKDLKGPSDPDAASHQKMLLEGIMTLANFVKEDDLREALFAEAEAMGCDLSDEETEDDDEGDDDIDEADT